MFEEVVIKSAKTLLNFIKSFHFYEKTMLYIEKSNDFILLFSFVFIITLAETISTIALFLLAKGFFISGIFFYVLKIIIYIPAIDIFKRNKQRLIKYKIVKFGIFIYEKIEKHPLFIEIRKKINIFKAKIIVKLIQFKEEFIIFWRNLWKT